MGRLTKKSISPDSKGRQKGRQQGSQTEREAAKSNSLEFFRHPGQGMRGEEGGQRERDRRESPKPSSGGTRKRTRPPAER